MLDDQVIGVLGTLLSNPHAAFLGGEDGLRFIACILIS